MPLNLIGLENSILAMIGLNTSHFIQPFGSLHAFCCTWHGSSDFTLVLIGAFVLVWCQSIE